VIVSIGQPAYLPWLGYFHRIAVSDVHVVLDDVQFGGGKDNYINRNRVLAQNGPAWLTVPVRTKGLSAAELAINRLEIADDQRWTAKHWGLLSRAYGRAPHVAEHTPFFRDTYEQPWTRLVDVVEHLTAYLLDAFAIDTKRVRSSDLGVAGTKSDLILNLCEAVGATHYLSGPFGREYLDLDQFQARNIAVSFHEYRHPVYPQCQPGFEPYMSAVDLLFNCGPDSRSILGREQEPLLP
jgi:WbqC-like protein